MLDINDAFVELIIILNLLYITIIFYYYNHSITTIHLHKLNKKVKTPPDAHSLVMYVVMTELHA